MESRYAIRVGSKNWPELSVQCNRDLTRSGVIFDNYALNRGSRYLFFTYNLYCSLRIVQSLHTLVTYTCEGNVKEACSHLACLHTNLRMCGIQNHTQKNDVWQRIMRNTIASHSLDALMSIPRWIKWHNERWGDSFWLVLCTVFCILRLSRAALQFRHRKQTRIHGYTYICTYITSILGIPQVNTHVGQRRVYQKAVYTPNQRVKSRIRAIKTALNRGCTVSDLSGVRVRGSLL